MLVLLGHLRHNAGQHGEAAGVVGGGLVILLRGAFDALLEHEVHTQADAEERHAGGDALAHYADLPELLHRGGRVGERAHARQHDGVGPGDGRGVGRDERATARRVDAALDALQVALAVVDDRDARGRHSAPFVEGSASPMRGSRSTAWRNARAAALNDASTR